MTQQEQLVEFNVRRLRMPYGFLVKPRSSTQVVWPIHAKDGGKQLAWRLIVVWCFGFKDTGEVNGYQIAIDQPVTEMWPLALWNEKLREKCVLLKEAAIRNDEELSKIVEAAVASQPVLEPSRIIIPN